MEEKVLLTSFNSIMVRLVEKETFFDGLTEEQRFNSIMVRLVDKLKKFIENFNRSFNSIMVRLVVANMAIKLGCSVFQFHNGAISSLRLQQAPSS